MRIGVNGRFLVAKRTGVQRAAYNLLTTLVKIDRENEYLIFTGGEELDQPEWQYDNVKIIASHIRSGENIRNHLWEQFILPRLVKRYNIDILHSPANIAPLFYRGKSIIHIHDLCFVVNPQWYSFSFRTLYNLMIPRLAKKATKVITNSNNSRNDLMQFFGISADKVSLVYWAVDEIFLDQKNRNKQTKLQEDEDYILYVGSLEPRKILRL
ncbi:MAG: glycosyltransferase [Bdellovibrionota bacterium]